MTALGLLLTAAIVPALLPPGGSYDPVPYFEVVKQSATLPLTPGDTPLAGDLTIRRARIVDVRGSHGPTSIRIEGGQITAIADNLATMGRELDVAGATVMPGLIDAHVHLSLTPGGLTRADDAATTRALRLHHMRAYLASGITTVFDPAVEVGVKMSFEPGFVRPVWRLHPPEIERAIVEEAAKRGLPIYVHAERAEMVSRALALHPYALVHGPIDGTAQLAAEIATRRIPVVTTLALFDAGTVMVDPTQLEAPHIRRVVPPIELASIHDRRQNRDSSFGLVTEVMPFVSGRYRDLLAWGLATNTGRRITEDQSRSLGRSAMQSIRDLNAAGAVLVLGSDSGNWPLFPYYFHGPTSWRELRLLSEAGLSPLEVLRTATVNAAMMLGLGEQLGTVEVGKAADLVVLREDPLVDVEKAMRSLEYTIRAGVARTPDEWMDDSP